MRSAAAARSARDSPPSSSGEKIARSLVCMVRTTSGRSRRSATSGEPGARPASASITSGAASSIVRSLCLLGGGKRRDVLVDHEFVAAQFRAVPGEQAAPSLVVVFGKQRRGNSLGNARRPDADRRDVAGDRPVAHERREGEAMHPLDPWGGTRNTLDEL